MPVTDRRHPDVHEASVVGERPMHCAGRGGRQLTALPAWASGNLPLRDSAVYATEAVSRMVIDVDGTRDAKTVANYFRRYLLPPQQRQQR